MQKSFYQMKGDVGMHNAKNHRNKSLHSKVIVQSLDHGVMYVPSSQNNDKDFIWHFHRIN